MSPRILELEKRVLETLDSEGHAAPSALVKAVSHSASATKSEVRDALHDLVSRRAVRLDWNGRLKRLT
jgi:hypothetical protein